MRFLGALFIAAAFHVGLIALLVFYFRDGVKVDEVARLDVSSVELSLSDSDSDVENAPDRPPQQKEALPPSVQKSTRPDFENAKTHIDAKIPVMDVLEIPKADEIPPPEMENSRTVNENPETEEKVEKKEIREAVESEAQKGNALNSALQQARVDVMPRLRSAIKPKYPKLSRERGEEGKIKLRLGINADGMAESVEIITSTGFRLLDDAAIRAVKAARFIPARLEGEAVFSTAEINLEFKLKSSNR